MSGAVPICFAFIVPRRLLIQAVRPGPAPAFLRVCKGDDSINLSKTASPFNVFLVRVFRGKISFEV